MADDGLVLCCSACGGRPLGLSYKGRPAWPKCQCPGEYKDRLGAVTYPMIILARYDLDEPPAPSPVDALRRVQAAAGSVCSMWEVCEHPWCRASYNAWAIATEHLETHGNAVEVTCGYCGGYGCLLVPPTGGRDAGEKLPCSSCGATGRVKAELHDGWTPDPAVQALISEYEERE